MSVEVYTSGERAIALTDLSNEEFCFTVWKTVYGV